MSLKAEMEGGEILARTRRVRRALGERECYECRYSNKEDEASHLFCSTRDDALHNCDWELSYNLRRSGLPLNGSVLAPIALSVSL